MSGAQSLANELHETNRLLRTFVEPKPEPGHQSDLMPAGGFFFIATFRAMRNALVDLPEQYWDRDLVDDTVTIVCKCRRGATLPNYSFHECKCGRVFCVTHRSVKVLPLDA